jgi:hypothetical protein
MNIFLDFLKSIDPKDIYMYWVSATCYHWVNDHHAYKIRQKTNFTIMVKYEGQYIKIYIFFTLFVIYHSLTWAHRLWGVVLWATSCTPFPWDTARSLCSRACTGQKMRIHIETIPGKRKTGDGKLLGLLRLIPSFSLNHFFGRILILAGLLWVHDGRTLRKAWWFAGYTTEMILLWAHVNKTLAECRAAFSFLRTKVSFDQRRHALAAQCAILLYLAFQPKYTLTCKKPAFLICPQCQVGLPSSEKKNYSAEHGTDANFDSFCRNSVCF